MKNWLNRIRTNKQIILMVIIIVVLLCLFLLNTILPSKENEYDQIMVKVSGQQLNVKVAKTVDQKILGLGELDKLPANEGMLFNYKNYIIPVYWMQGMRFPIDIIWIKDDIVVGYEKDLSPPINNTSLQTYQPKTLVNFVLEVNAGFVDKYDLRIGDRIEF